MHLLIPPRLIDEICQVGKLEDYRMPLTDLITRIYADGLKVSTRYDVGHSSILNGHVRVTLIGVIHPLDIIWELIHEYGHFLSGERKPEDTDLEREEKAWFYADKLIVSFPHLVPHYEKYNICKQRCLKSYQLQKSRT
jgi:hypothetical protein